MLPLIQDQHEKRPEYNWNCSWAWYWCMNLVRKDDDNAVPAAIEQDGNEFIQHPMIGRERGISQCPFRQYIKM